MDVVVPWNAVLGGALIGTSASLLLALNGRIAGISGILAGLLRPRAGDVAWRAWFIGGLVGGAVLLRLFQPSAFGVVSAPATLVLMAGLLVGFGTRLGSGCTSGHGVCGLSRLSQRSLVATLTFMATGALATFVVRHMLHLGSTP